MSRVGAFRPKSPIPLPLQDDIFRFLEHIRTTQSPTTYASYHQALTAFTRFLANAPTNSRISTSADLTLTDAQDFLFHLQQTYSTETEHAYFRAVVAFIRTTSTNATITEDLLEKLQNLAHTARRKKARQEPKIPFNSVDKIKQYLITQPIPDATPDANIQRQRLRTLRDKALIFTIIDAGFKPSEIASLHIADFDQNTSSIRSPRTPLPIQSNTYHAIQEYLHERIQLDQQQRNAPYSSLPLFARHDKRASDHVLAISRWTVGNIISYWSNLAGEPSSEEKHTLTPSLLRHYFVASTLEETHDIELTQKRARHKDKGTTRRYLRRPNTTSSD